MYFVPVLLWCKVLCKYKNVVWQILLSVLSLTSIQLTSMSIIPYNEIITPYTNPFNFLIYFQVGMFYRKYHLNLNNYRYLLPATATLIALFFVLTPHHSYFSLFCIPIAISAFILMYYLAVKIPFGETVGKLSYVIYLCHLIPVSILNRHILEWFGPWFDYVKVPIVFSIIAFVVWSGYYLLRTLKLNSISSILGYR